MLYNKDSEGSSYNDGTKAEDKSDDYVDPGRIHVYRWFVTERAGPGPNDASSMVWVYHGHANEVSNSGLVGPLIITGRGMSRSEENLMPKDVDREFFTAFWVINENESPLLGGSVEKFMGAKLGKGVDDGHPQAYEYHSEFESVPEREQGAPLDDSVLTMDDREFYRSNLKNVINGYMYGNMPPLQMELGERVRWYVLTIGDEIDVHAPTWEGQTLVFEKKRVDTAALIPVTQSVYDMEARQTGAFKLACATQYHRERGEETFFLVVNNSQAQRTAIIVLFTSFSTVTIVILIIILRRRKKQPPLILNNEF